MSLEELELELIDAGAEEIEKDEDFITIYTDFVDFGKMSEKLEQLEVEVKNAELQRIPLNTVELPLEETKKIIELVEKFEEDEDVQNVFHNLEISDNLIEAIQEA